MISLDTNVVVRVLVDDDHAQATRAMKRLRSDNAWVSRTVLLETEWVLRHAYRLDAAKIRKASFVTFDRELTKAAKRAGTRPRSPRLDARGRGCRPARCHGATVALIKHELLAGRVPITHGGVVGQVWRGGSGRQANLARLLPALRVSPLDLALGRRAGMLMGKARTADVIDAALVLLTSPSETTDRDAASRLRRARRCLRDRERRRISPRSWR